MPTFSRVSHISFSVRDAEASARWWAALLELTEIDRVVGDGWRGILLVHRWSRTIIEFQQHDGNQGEAFDQGRFGGRDHRRADVMHLHHPRKPMTMETTNRKVAIVTGASQGIGAGLVEAYRRRNYAVVANSRTITTSDDPGVLTIAGDIADPATAEQLVTGAVERFGRVDTLINNAGVFIAKPFTQYTAADYALITAVNLTGFFHITQRVIAQLLAQGDGGNVVNVTTTLVEHANLAVPSALTSLTKGGLAAVTKSLAIEHARNGIRVNAISPGVVATPMHADDAHAVFAGTHPLGRMGTIADIIRGVLYLETATFVTGEFLHVDGGQSAGH